MAKEICHETCNILKHSKSNSGTFQKLMAYFMNRLTVPPQVHV